MRSVHVVGLFSLVATGCVAPSTVQRGITQEQILREEAKQRAFVVSSQLAQVQRVTELSYGLLRAGRQYCTNSTAPRVGITSTTREAFSTEWRAAAATVGISDTLTVTAIASESAAGSAGMAPGDRILALDGTDIPSGAAAAKTFTSQLQASLARNNGQAQIRYARGSELRDVILVADTLCDYGVDIKHDESVQAVATGREIFVYSGLLNALNDEEVTTVLSHEIAHNAMKHVQATQSNAALGAIFGALLDVAAASQGVNTGGRFTGQFAQLAAMTFSQEFESEADYVGMYILAAAGQELERAPNLWRRFAALSPGSIRFATSHPTTVERYIRLEQAAAEIAEKRALGVALMPETKQSRSQRSAILANAPTVTQGRSTAILAPTSKPSIAAPSSALPNAATSLSRAAPPPAPSTTLSAVFGSRVDKVYFLNGCAAVSDLDEVNKQRFKSEADAQAAGYRRSSVPACGATLATKESAATGSVSYFGSRVDKVFFRANCVAAQDLALGNRRTFATEADALRAGYRRTRVQGC
jgi:hypothetical protein